LGVSYVLISRQAAVVNEIPEGALVREITSGSPAESAGIQVDDIITQIDGEKITSTNTLASIVNKKKVGQKINLKVYRDGKAMDITATLAQVPDSQ
jgi:serine protease Do